jgi:fructose-specific phosphotransferase system component IIB
MKKKNNVINFPKKYIGKRKVKLPNKDVIRINEDMGFADQLTEAIIVQMVHVLSDNDIKVNDTQFVKDLSFVIESIKSAVYRDLNLKHEIQPLVDKFMVQEKNEKGQTNTIFKMELIQKFLKAAEKKK